MGIFLNMNCIIELRKGINTGIKSFQAEELFGFHNYLSLDEFTHKVTSRAVKTRNPWKSMK